MMDLTIIIVNYNTYRLTCDCLQSILKCGTSLSLEIILIDNASTETTAGTFVRQFPDIKLIENKSNAGFSKAVNQGLKAASGKHLLLLNSDTVVNRNALESCWHFLDQHDKYGVVTCRLLFPGGGIQHNCQQFPSFSREFVLLLRMHRWILKKRKQQLMGSFFDHQQHADPDWVWGTFFMFRRELLHEQQLDDRYFMYGEDMLWCYQMKAKGLKAAFLPGPYIVHLQGASSSDSKKQILIAHEMHFIKSNYAAAHAFLLICCRLLNYATLAIKKRLYLQLILMTIKCYTTPVKQLLNPSLSG